MKNVTDFDDILIGKYGKKGTERRDKYDQDSLAVVRELNFSQLLSQL